MVACQKHALLLAMVTIARVAHLCMWGRRVILRGQREKAWCGVLMLLAPAQSRCCPLQWRPYDMIGVTARRVPALAQLMS